MTRCRREHKSWTELGKFLKHLKRSHAVTGSAALKDAQHAQTVEMVGTIGVCAFDYKARSRLSRQLLTRLQGNGEFEIVVFGDKAILDDGMLFPQCLAPKKILSPGQILRTGQLADEGLTCHGMDGLFILLQYFFEEVVVEALAART